MSNSTSSKIGFYSIVLLGINGIIGSGIFLLPGQVMALAHQQSLIVFAFVTLMVLTIAWSFAKCASYFNKNGGAYVYAKEAFGPFVGFQVGIMRWAVGIIAWATLTVGFVTALSTIWPLLLLEPNRTVFIIGIISFLGGINTLGVDWIKPLNNMATIAKLLPLIGFICAGIFFINTDVIFPDLSTSTNAEFSFGAAVLLTFYAFSGFENLAVVAGEMENPKKNLPLALMLVVSICSGIYMLIQLISMSILHADLATSVTPIADVAQIIWGTSGKWFVLCAMLVSIAGINICSSFVVPRSGEALANDGMLPQWIGVRCRFGTPIYAIILSVIFTIILALFGTFTQLAMISVIARLVQYTSTCLAALVLGREERKSQSFLKKVLHLFIPLLGLTCVGWLFTQASLSQLYWGLGALIFGLPLYYIQRFSQQELFISENKTMPLCPPFAEVKKLVD